MCAHEAPCLDEETVAADCHEQHSAGASSMSVSGGLLGKTWVESVTFHLINIILFSLSLALSKMKSSSFLPKWCCNWRSACFPWTRNARAKNNYEMCTQWELNVYNPAYELLKSHRLSRSSGGRCWKDWWPGGSRQVDLKPACYVTKSSHRPQSWRRKRSDKNSSCHKPVLRDSF